MRKLNFLFLFGCFALGCNSNTTMPTATTVTIQDDHDHSHDRAKMQVAHLGKHHAWLTAHLSSKDGHELDIFIEELDAPNPVALTLQTLQGKATKVGDDKEYKLVFEPAPASERPAGEGVGKCSHYVAKAPWLTPDDTWVIVVEAELEGRIRKGSWKKFVPKTFAHHED